MDRLLAQCACCSGLRSAEVARRLVAAKAAPANAGCPTGIASSISPRGRSAPDSTSAVRACAKGPPWAMATSSASFHRNGLLRRARRARRSATSLSREEARVRVTQALRACWPISSARVTTESSASGSSKPGTCAGSCGSTRSSSSGSFPNTPRMRCSATGSGRRLTGSAPSPRKRLVTRSSAKRLRSRCSSDHSGRRLRTSSTRSRLGASRLSVAAARCRWSQLIPPSFGSLRHRANSIDKALS